MSTKHHSEEVGNDDIYSNKDSSSTWNLEFMTLYNEISQRTPRVWYDLLNLTLEYFRMNEQNQSSAEATPQKTEGIKSSANSNNSNSSNSNNSRNKNFIHSIHSYALTLELNEVDSLIKGDFSIFKNHDYGKDDQHNYILNSEFDDRKPESLLIKNSAVSCYSRMNKFKLINENNEQNQIKEHAEPLIDAVNAELDAVTEKLKEIEQSSNVCQSEVQKLKDDIEWKVLVIVALPDVKILLDHLNLFLYSTNKSYKSFKNTNPNSTIIFVFDDYKNEPHRLVLPSLSSSVSCLLLSNQQFAEYFEVLQKQFKKTLTVIIENWQETKTPLSTHSDSLILDGVLQYALEDKFSFSSLKQPDMKRKALFVAGLCLSHGIPCKW